VQAGHPTSDTHTSHAATQPQRALTPISVAKQSSELATADPGAGVTSRAPSSLSNVSP
jgi:hypothetical protein